MDKREFLTKLKKRGYISNRDDAVAAMQKFRNGGGVFDDEIKQNEPVQQQQRPEPTQAEKYGVAGALFPATTEATERGGGFLSRAVAGAGDVLTAPARAVSAGATYLGTRHGGGSIPQAAKEAGKEFSRTKSTEKGALGFAQNMALDPTSSPLIMIGAAPAKAAKAGSKAIPTVGKALLKAGTAGAAEAAGSAAYQQAKEGKVSAGRTAAQGALGFGIGAGSAGLGKAVRKGAGKLLESTAIRNIDIALRPGQYGRKIGYNHDNVIKHDLVGSPRETFEKATAKLNDLQKKAKKIGKRSRKKFDIEQMFDETIGSLDPKKKPKYHQKKVDELTEAKEAYITAHGKFVDAPTAMKIRTEIGDESAFVGRTFGGQKIDPDATWKEDAYNKLYFKFKNELQTKIGKGTELKAINKAQSEIIPVKQVAERRMPIAGSNQRIGLSDLLTTRVGQSAAAGVLGAGVGAGTYGEDRFKGALGGLAVGAGVAAGRRAFGSPTATKALYKTGKAITPKVGKVGGRKARSLLKSQRGSIGSAADEIIGTPAIRDPKTGKIYVGGWRGHKDAIIKGESEAVQSRLRHEHFKDNTNQATKNVGFIDDNGNFISRSEAEKIVERKLSGSLIQQFHNVGIMAGTAAGAGGALTIGSKLSQRKKRK